MVLVKTQQFFFFCRNALKRPVTYISIPKTEAQKLHPLFMHFLNAHHISTKCGAYERKAWIKTTKVEKATRKDRDCQSTAVLLLKAERSRDCGDSSAACSHGGGWINPTLPVLAPHLQKMHTGMSRLSQTRDIWEQRDGNNDVPGRIHMQR